jgi:predicted HTH domain antitoxin
VSDRSAVSFGGMRELQGKAMRKSLSTVRSRRQQLTSSMDQRSNADNPRPLRSSHDSFGRASLLDDRFQSDLNRFVGKVAIIMVHSEAVRVERI